jgi:hypothetical protein
MLENMADYYAGLEEDYDGEDESLSRWQDYDREPYLELDLVKRLSPGTHLPPFTVGMIRGDDPDDHVAEHLAGARISMVLRRWEVNLQDEEDKLLPVEWEQVQQLSLEEKKAWMKKLLSLDDEATGLMPFEACTWFYDPEADWQEEGYESPLYGIDPAANATVERALAPAPTVRTQPRDEIVFGLY